MLAIIIYVGLFAWGMNSDRLTLKHGVVIGTIIALQIGVSYYSIGMSALRTGVMSLGEIIFVALIDAAITSGLFFLGYFIAGYRRRRTAADDVADTFS